MNDEYDGYNPNFDQSKRMESETVPQTLVRWKWEILAVSLGLALVLVLIAVYERCIV